MATQTVTPSAAPRTDFVAVARELAADFATRAAQHDADDSFVAENYAALKIFGSGGPSGDLLLTTGIYDDPEKGPTVLHFGVNLHQPGVTIQDNWRTLGMRGTGSNDIVIENVDVADAGVSVRRPKGTWAPFFDVVTPLIWPLVCAAYLGVAESARELAVAHVQKKRDDPIVQITVGEMDTELANAQAAYDDMVATAKGLDYTPSHGLSNISYKRKTIFSRSATRAVSCAMEAVGGG